jgi:UDP-3-O-[3-hydroxymyristoyl] N-acetylglucosamine deacetylase
MRQQTIKRSVSLEGVGLHSGKPTRITLLPAPADSGIVFRTPGGAVIPAAPESVVDCHYATTIGRDGPRVQTIEHLMAAAAGLGIDNLEIQVEGPEVPAVDGSAKPFVALLGSAGRAQHSARRRPPVEIPHPIRVGTGGRWIQIVPAPDLRISYTLDNDHPAIGVQVRACAPTEEQFVSEYAPARTYGFLRDLGVMRKNGLALGGSLDNAIVVGKRGTLNGLRFRDEFVRHKILDLIGDLALLGRPIHGHVIARNGGHALNFELVVAIQRALGLERRPAGVPVPVPAAVDVAVPVPAAAV